VPHVELSVSDPHAARRAAVESSLDRWATAVAGAAEACLVIDSQAVIVALSRSCHDLLALDRPAVGRSLVGGVLRLVDFSPAGGALTDNEVGKIAPLLALSSGRLARGLLRVQCARGVCTLDAVATPLLDGSTVAGSLTFFSQL
jgi:hypothetical protein